MDVPALLSGETVEFRPVWRAESGMCEPDCAPGCAPTGLAGRDRVIMDDGGRWIDRPGRGRYSEGQPAPGLDALIDEIPALALPSGPGSDAAESLGYLDPL
jgi:hypothetical protein